MKMHALPHTRSEGTSIRNVDRWLDHLETGWPFRLIRAAARSECHRNAVNGTHNCSPSGYVTRDGESITKIFILRKKMYRDKKIFARLKCRGIIFRLLLETFLFLPYHSRYILVIIYFPRDCRVIIKHVDQSKINKSRQVKTKSNKNVKKKGDKNVPLTCFWLFYHRIFLRQKSHDSLKARKEMEQRFKYRWNLFRIPDFEIILVYEHLIESPSSSWNLQTFWRDILLRYWKWERDYTRGCFSFSLCVSFLTFQVSSLTEIARNNAVAHGSREILTVPFNSFVTKGNAIISQLKQMWSQQFTDFTSYTRMLLYQVKDKKLQKVRAI